MNDAAAAAAVLEVDDLSVEFRSTERLVHAVRGVSFTVGRAETVAIVGESGSGKSVTALSLMRLVEHGGGTITSGSLLFERPGGARTDLARVSSATMQSIRGAEIAMIFQEPMTSLNPVFTVGEQIAESIRLHQGVDAASANREALRMLDQVRIPESAQVLGRYPHQLSGGMRQRVMIAMAIACKPRLLIADEPTTALDVTIQAQILELLRDLRKELSMSVMLISHDLGVIAEFAQRVIVMYAGRVVEDAPVAQLFRRPVHPYTMGLIAAVPKLDGDAPRLATIPGRIPSPQEVIPGCRFSPRCTLVQDGCLGTQPAMQPAGDRQSARCPPRLLALGERHG
jgi:oligopeptide/dipeptide ABC transporter ATP-binding protein